MTEPRLHPTSRWRNVVLEQIRIVGSSLRPAALVVAAASALSTVVIVGDIARGRAGFDSDEMFPTSLIAFLFPFAVWRSEKRFGPGFLWTFPVDRRRLALAKVFAGFVWLVAGLALFICWLLTLGLVAGASPEQTVMRIPFTPTIAMYLFGSAVVLGLRHPVRWVLGAAGVFFLMGTLGDAFTQPDDSEWQYVPGSGAFFSVTSRVVAAWLTLPEPAQWAVRFGAGLAAVWAAASRHRDRRRR